MIGSVLHYIMGCEACQLRFCTIRLYFKHYFIYRHPTDSHTSAFVFFIVVLMHFWSIHSCNCQNMVKGPCANSVNHSSGHLFKLYETELKSITCGYPIFACSFIVIGLS